MGTTKAARASVIAVVLAVLVTLTGWVPRTPAAAVNCSADVVFMGLRGSGESAADYGTHGRTVDTILTRFRGGVSGKRSVAIETFSDSDYPSRAVSAIGMEAYVPGGAFLASVEDGVDALTRRLNRVATDCNSWIVLAGYSQGALVIRQAVIRASNAARARIAGIALMADPGRVGAGDGLDHFGGAGGAGHLGIYDSVLGVKAAPPAPRGRGLAASWCLSGDDVCDFSYPNLARENAKRLVGLFSLHDMYKYNSMAALSGIYLAEDLLKLPSRPVTVTSTPPPPPPPPAPRVPEGNYVSTCNLGGADHCTGVNLRSQPLWPGWVTGTLGELVTVDVICAKQGTPIHDAVGHNSPWWAWVRAKNGAGEGYVSYLYVYGGITTPPPHCGPLLESASPATVYGGFRSGGVLNFSFPLRSNGALPATIRNLHVRVHQPDGSDADMPCSGGGTVTMQPSATWTCNATYAVTQFGDYTAYFRWQRDDGSWTDGTPDLWTTKWGWRFTIDFGPLQGVSSDIDTSPLVTGDVTNIVTTIRNGLEQTVTIPQIAHVLNRAADNNQTRVVCATNVTLAPGQTFECRAKLEFPVPGRYTSWLAYQLPSGQWYQGKRLFTSDWEFQTSPRPPVRKLEVVKQSIDSAAQAGTPLVAEFTVRNVGENDVAFYPNLQTDPIVYGGFGDCEGVDYSGNDLAGAAVKLPVGAEYTCVTRQVLPPEAVGSHTMTAAFLFIKDGAINGQALIPLANLDVAPAPPPPTIEDVPLAPQAVDTTPIPAIPLAVVTTQPPTNPNPATSSPPPNPDPAASSPAPITTPAPTTPAPRITVTASKDRGKVRINIDPDLSGKAGWKLKLQRQKSNGDWVTGKKKYTTIGKAETLTVNPKKGTYRIVTLPRPGYASATSAPITLRK